MLPGSDLEYWNRRASPGAIFANLRWTWSHIRAHAGPAAIWLILIHILLGIQPALLIHVTRHLVDAVVDAAGGGPSDFDDILPWLIAFGLVLLLTREVLWNVRDILHLRMEQNLAHVLGRRLLERSSRLSLLFFDVSGTYDRLERARDPGRKLDRLFFAALHFFQAAIKAVSVAAMFFTVSPWISLATGGGAGAADPPGDPKQSRMFMAFTYGETPEERRAGYVDRILTGRTEQKEMRLFGLHPPLTGRWRRMRQVLRERLLGQRQTTGREGVARNRVTNCCGGHRGRRPRVPSWRPGNHAGTIRGAVPGCGQTCWARAPVSATTHGSCRSAPRRSVTCANSSINGIGIRLKRRRTTGSQLFAGSFLSSPPARRAFLWKTYTSPTPRPIHGRRPPQSCKASHFTWRRANG